MRYCQENKKECALAHSRAEARLLRQPSTLAPSAHPRRAFIIVWKQSFLYDKKESCEAGFSACGGSRKRHSTIPPQCDPRGAFLSYGNEVSYTIKKRHSRNCHAVFRKNLHSAGALRRRNREANVQFGSAIIATL